MNALGQRINVSTSGSAFPATPSWAWGYDALGQVISADHSTDNAFDRAYQYDTIGNRLQGIAGVSPASVTNYTSNALNQYSSLSLNSQPPTLNQYDFDGNLTSGQLPTGSAGLVWDAENRLIAVNVIGQDTTFYTYDSQSRRIASTKGTASTIYIYDAWNVIAEYSSPNLQSPISHVRSYLWGTDLSGSMQGAGGVGGLLSVTSHSALLTSHFPAYDGNGNVSEYLTSNGSVTAHFEYDPFGNTVVNTDASGQFEFRFSTKPLDSAAGLYYYGYRYYDPVTGRWPSKDPIQERGGINLYAFVGNSGVNRLDLLGLSASEEECQRTAELLQIQLKLLIEWNDKMKKLDDQWNKDFSDTNKSKCEEEAVPPEATDVLLAAASEVVALGGCLGSTSATGSAAIGASCTYVGVWMSSIAVIKTGADYYTDAQHSECMKERLKTWQGDKEAYQKEYEITSYYLDMWLTTYQNTYKWLSENCQACCCESESSGKTKN